MKIRSLFVSWLTIEMSSLLSGCDSPTSPSSAPHLIIPTFFAPATGSDSSGAIKAIKFASLFNQQISRKYLAICSGPATSQSDTSWTWIGRDEIGNQATWIAYKGHGFWDEAGYHWKFFIAEPSGIHPVEYDGWAMGDGSMGEFAIAFPSYHGNFSWITTGGGVIGTISPGGESWWLQCKSYSNKSGEINESGGACIVFRALWKSDGSGEWWEYDSTGVLLKHSTWQ
jgi:hypothetical protein